MLAGLEFGEVGLGDIVPEYVAEFVEEAVIRIIVWRMVAEALGHPPSKSKYLYFEWRGTEESKS